MSAHSQHATYALASLPPDVQEEVCVATLKQLWGAGEMVSFIEDHLERDAQFWAATATPAMLAAYLPAVADALHDTLMGSQIREWVIRSAFVGLPVSVRKALLADLTKTPAKPAPSKKAPINKVYAAALARRNGSSKGVEL